MLSEEINEVEVSEGVGENKAGASSELSAAEKKEHLRVKDCEKHKRCVIILIGWLFCINDTTEQRGGIVNHKKLSFYT